MNIAAEFLAALPAPRVILGVRLLPLSVGRYRLLKRFECPFVADQSLAYEAEQLPALAKELFFALLVCGLPVAEFKRFLQSPKALAKEANRFGKNVGKIIKRTPGFSLLQVIAQFESFIKDSSALPWHAMPRAGERGQESVSHWSHSIEVALRARAGWTQNEIDEEPLTKALADFFKLIESEGLVDLVTHEDYAAFKQTGDDNARILLEFQARMEGSRN